AAVAEVLRLVVHEGHEVEGALGPALLARLADLPQPEQRDGPRLARDLGALVVAVEGEEAQAAELARVLALEEGPQVVVAEVGLLARQPLRVGLDVALAAEAEEGPEEGEVALALAGLDAEERPDRDVARRVLGVEVVPLPVDDRPEDRPLVVLALVLP